MHQEGLYSRWNERKERWRKEKVKFTFSGKTDKSESRSPCPCDAVSQKGALSRPTLYSIYFPKLPFNPLFNQPDVSAGAIVLSKLFAWNGILERCYYRNWNKKGYPWFLKKNWNAILIALALVLKCLLRIIKIYRITCYSMKESNGMRKACVSRSKFLPKCCGSNGVAVDDIARRRGVSPNKWVILKIGAISKHQGRLIWKEKLISRQWNHCSSHQHCYLHPFYVQEKVLAFVVASFDIKQPKLNKRIRKGFRGTLHPLPFLEIKLVQGSFRIPNFINWCFQLYSLLGKRNFGSGSFYEWERQILFFPFLLPLRESTPVLFIYLLLILFK